MKFFRIIFLLNLFLLTNACKDDEDLKLPQIETQAISNITAHSATAGGNIHDDRGLQISSRGVCWSTGIIPTTSDNKTSDGGGTGEFISEITGLIPSTIYYVRAYANTEAGTSYGITVPFTTQGVSPVAVTLNATGIMTDSATLNGVINANNINSSIKFEYGTDTTYSLSVAATPGSANNSTDTNVSAVITGLSAAALYHFRVVVESESDTVYGDDLTFNTIGALASVITDAATNLSSNGATLNGRVNPNLLSTLVVFEYGTSIVYGQNLNANPNFIDGNSTFQVSANLTGLLPNTTYYYRLRAGNEAGVAYGEGRSFTTGPGG